MTRWTDSSPPRNLLPLLNSTRTCTMARCTPSIGGWPPNRPPCAGWPRWSRAASNPWRYLARWPRRCADACLRTPPDCGASNRIARLPSWPPLPILRRWRDGRWARELRWTATPSQCWCNAAAGPHGSTATTMLPGRSLACARWACARRWGCRSSLMDALLEGRVFDEWSLRDLAGQLRLPIHGPFVVIAAHVPAAGDEALPEIESKLRSLDIFSAWRLLPDVQVGVVHIESDRKLDRFVALMSRMTTVRVGVSAAFTDLRDTPRGLHVARVM